jgi:hypothetical protein
MNEREFQKMCEENAVKRRPLLFITNLDYGGADLDYDDTILQTEGLRIGGVQYWSAAAGAWRQTDLGEFMQIVKEIAGGKPPGFLLRPGVSEIVWRLDELEKAYAQQC